METKEINDIVSTAMCATAEVLQGKAISNISIPTNIPKEIREHIMNCLWAIEITARWKH